MVSKYLIEERAGVRIGIMGIGIRRKRPSISCNYQIDEFSSGQLKSELACDEVYVCTERPDSSNLLL